MWNEKGVGNGVAVGGKFYAVRWIQVQYRSQKPRTELAEHLQSSAFPRPPRRDKARNLAEKSRRRIEGRRRRKAGGLHLRNSSRV